MTAVTLSWRDPEDAAEFLLLREQLARYGWLPDPSRDVFLDLARKGEVVKDGSEEEERDG